MFGGMNVYVGGGVIRGEVLGFDEAREDDAMKGKACGTCFEVGLVGSCAEYHRDDTLCLALAFCEAECLDKVGLAFAWYQLPYDGAKYIGVV